MKLHDELKAYLEQQLPGELELLKKLVAINSFTTNKPGVNEQGQVTAAEFEQLGFKAEFVASVRPDFGEHLVLTKKGRTSKTIGLISHLDTVYPAEEEQRNHFSWRPAGDRIYGPGTVDIKGGTVVLHMTLLGIMKFAPEIFEEMNWVVLLNSSEEVMSHDFGKLCLDRLGENCLGALVFEAGARNGDTYAFVTARKGRAVFRVTAEGRGAHAGSHHERGANAVVQLADAVQRIAALTDYSKQLTYNVGIISGGAGLNRVPHEAVAEGEMRTFDMNTYREGVRALMALNSLSSVKSADDEHPCRIKIEITQESPPWPKNEKTERLFQLWSAASRAMGLAAVREERGGISDGNFICHKVPTLDGLGPNGDNAHCSEQSPDGTKEQEYVEVSSMIPKAAMNALAVIELGKSGDRKSEARYRVSCGKAF